MKGQPMSAFTYPARLTTGSDLGSDLSIRLSRREDIPKPSGLKRWPAPVPVPLLTALGKQMTVEVRDAP